MSKAELGSLAVEVGPGGRMSLVEHLRELRNRVLISAAAIVVGIGVSYYFWEPIYDFLRAPYCSTTLGKRNCNLYALGIFEQFQVRVRIAILAGILLASPVWIFHIGRYITPGLHRHERRYAVAFMAAGMTLFSAGVAMAYLTVSRGLDIFLSVGGGHVVPLVTIQSYLSFITLLLLAFGAAFEFPLIVMFLNITGALSASRMRKSRRGVFFGLMLVSSILVPTTDPFTFLAMALPLYLLYEACVLAARVRERRGVRKQRELDAFEASLAAELGLTDLSAGL